MQGNYMNSSVRKIFLWKNQDARTVQKFESLRKQNGG